MSSADRTAVTVRPPMRAAIAAAASRLMSATTTLAPQPASRIAQASPIPLPPPVTTASRPASSSLIRYPPSVIVCPRAPKMTLFYTRSWCRGRGQSAAFAMTFLARHA